MRRGRDEDETTCSVGAETIQHAVEYPIPTALEPVWSAYNPCITDKLSQAVALQACREHHPISHPTQSGKAPPARKTGRTQYRRGCCSARAPGG
jgi:hypothetical protein